MQNDNVNTMIFGYARVSTETQKLDSQIKPLEDYGCDEIVTESASGKGVKGRPALQALLSKLRRGDTLVLSAIDRLSRDVADTTAIVKEVREKGARLITLDGMIDTNNAGVSDLILYILAFVAQSEREKISERTKKGLEAARAKGRFGGRKNALNEEKKRFIAHLYSTGERTVTQLARSHNVSRPTIYNALRSQGVEV